MQVVVEVALEIFQTQVFLLQVELAVVVQAAS
jgi:hypothetical protein